jgi:hypothetical protein
MEKLESIRQKKDAELVRARGLAGPLVRSVRRSAAAVALGLDITLEDARILKGQIDALVRDACKASGIAMRAVAVALEQVAPIAEEVADAMEEDEQH